MNLNLFGSTLKKKLKKEYLRKIKELNNIINSEKILLLDYVNNPFRDLKICDIFFLPSL